MKKITPKDILKDIEQNMGPGGKYYIIVFYTGLVSGIYCPDTKETLSLVKYDIIGPYAPDNVHIEELKVVNLLDKYVKSAYSVHKLQGSMTDDRQSIISPVAFRITMKHRFSN